MRLTVQQLLGLCGLGYALALVLGCAVVSRPTGGDEDRLAPKLDTARSTAPLAVGVRPELLVLEFDEYVTLSNASRTVVLTPTPEAGRPQYRQRGRRVEVDLSDVRYRDSTTYQLLFGDAVRDLNANNPAQRLRYVWSTGPELDSLQIAGQVVDHFSGEAQIGVLVGLYRNLSDSAVVQLGPDYFTTTDSTGRFQLDYLSPGRYRLLAFADGDENRLLNVGTEAVAFLNEELVLGPQETRIDSSYVLSLALERPDLFVLAAEVRYPGLLTLALNQAADTALSVRLLARNPDPLSGSLVYAQQDTLLVAYTERSDTLARRVLVGSAAAPDTFNLRRNRPKADSLPRLRFVGRARARTGLPGLALTLNLPLRAVNPERIEVFDVDSSLLRPAGDFALSTNDPLQLSWIPSSDSARSYRMRLLPGALTDYWGRELSDTLEVNVRTEASESFGEVALSLEGLDSTQAYVLELYEGGGAGADEPPVRRLQLQPGEAQLTLSRLPAGDYLVRLITDLDDSGTFTPPSVRARRQPEPVSSSVLNGVRANWLVEQTLTFSGL